MAFKNIARQGLRPGHLVRYELSGLAAIDGVVPAFMVEHYGASNSTFIGEAVLNAGVPPAVELPSEVAPPASSREAFELWEKQWEEHRGGLAKYCVRDVEGFYHDGANGEPDLEHPASSTDIPDILAALPPMMLIDLFTFCLNGNNFRTAERKAEVEDIAKK